MEKTEMSTDNTVKASPEMLRAFINLSIKIRDLCVIQDEMMEKDPNEYSDEERAENTKAIAYLTQDIERQRAELAELEGQNEVEWKE